MQFFKIRKSSYGILSALCAVFIWAGWVVSSRWGITTDFSPVDLTWLRFSTASLVLLPYSLRYPWHKVDFKKAVIVALGCGFPYVWLAYAGLTRVPSANASVLINGFLPIMTSFLGFVFLKQVFSRAMLLLMFAILCATLLMSYQPAAFSWHSVAGLGFLMLATTVLAIYMLAVKTWNVEMRDILAWVPLINVFILFPVWLFTTDGINHFLELPLQNLLFHMAYQGVLVSVVGLFMFSFAIKTVGTFTASVFMAWVPVLTALMALFFFNEQPSTLQWLGIILCTASLIAYNTYVRHWQKMKTAGV